MNHHSVAASYLILLTSLFFCDLQAAGRGARVCCGSSGDRECAGARQERDRVERRYSVRGEGLSDPDRRVDVDARRRTDGLLAE